MRPWDHSLRGAAVNFCGAGLPFDARSCAGLRQRTTRGPLYADLPLRGDPPPFAARESEPPPSQPPPRVAGGQPGALVPALRAGRHTPAAPWNRLARVRESRADIARRRGCSRAAIRSTGSFRDWPIRALHGVGGSAVILARSAATRLKQGPRPGRPHREPPRPRARLPRQSAGASP